MSCPLVLPVLGGLYPIARFDWVAYWSMRFTEAVGDSSVGFDGTS